MGDNKANSESLESRIAKLEAALEIAEQRADALTAEISSLNADGATFRMLQDTMPLGYHNLDENGNILNVNKEWLSFFEYEMEEVIGRNFSEFLSPDIKDIFKSRFEGFKRAGIVKNVEFTVVKKSGRTATVSFNGVVSRNSDGSFDRTHCIFEDITELKKQEERHRIIAELLDITPASITIHDASGEFYYANKTTFEMHGYEPKDFYKKNIREIDAPVSRALYKERVEKLLEKGKANFEVEHIHKNGSLFPLEVNTKVVELEDKKVFLSVASDIARRKQEEARIKLFALVLSILNRGSDLDETIRVALLAIKEHLDIEAVGIRLKEGGDYPYRQTEGFSSEFVSLENNLCALDADGSVVLDNNGNPVLECMCGNVIRGIFNPDLPFFTAGGSFWTNSTSDLLASTSEADRQASTRNRFNGEGYESVALIPLKVGHETLGLLQLNDRRVGKFSLETIIFLEGLSNSIGLAASRLRSVELLRHTMEKYRIVADNTYDWENWITPEGRFIYSSPACERITGRTPEDFIADPELLLKIIHPDDREEAQSFWDEMQSTRERNDHKFRIVRPDGSIRWIGHAYKRVYGDNGEYMGLRNSFRDITNSQLKTLENEAWNASALSVLQSNNFEEAAKTIFDNAKLLTGAKSGYVALLSKDSSENEVLFLDSGGAPCDVDPLLPMPIRGLRAEAYKTGRAVYHNDFMNSEWQSMMPAGHVALKNVMFAPINIDGEVAGLIGLANKPGAFTDDDSRVAYVLSSLAAIALKNSRNMEALKESESRFRALITGSTDAMMTLEPPDWRFTSCNPATVEMFGAQSENDINGLSPVELSPFFQADGSESEKKAVEMVNKAMSEGAAVFEWTHRRMDGTTFDALVSVARITINNTPILLSATRNVTDNKRAENALRAMAESETGSDTDIFHLIVRKTAETLGKNIVFISKIGESEPDVAHTVAVWMHGGFVDNFSYSLKGTPCANVLVDGECLYPDNLESLFPKNINFPHSGAVSYWGIALRGANGMAIGIIAMLDDKPMAISQHSLSLIKSFALRASAEMERLKTEEKYQLLFERMLDGFALHEIILDEDKRPVDYRFLNVNPAFEKLTGLRAVDIVGKTVLEVLPGTEKKWIEIYGYVAKTGESAHFTSYTEPLGRYFEVAAFSPARGQFAAIFTDITERQLALNSLRESEEGYRSLVESSKDHIFMLSKDGIFLSSNGNADHVGLEDCENIVGKKLEDVYDEDVAKSYREHLRRVFSSGKSVDFYHDLMRGKEKRAHIDTLYPIWEKKEIKAAGGICRDITEHKEAENALREALAELSIIHASAPIAMLLVNRDRRVEKVNEAAAFFSNRKTDEMTGMIGGEALRCLHNYDDPKGCGFGPYCATCPIRLAVMETFETGKRNTGVEVWLPTFFEDIQTERCLLISTDYLDFGETGRVLICAQDITERKHAENALRDSESRYRELVENANSIILRMDLFGNLTFANEFAEKFFGYTRQELLGSNVVGTIVPQKESSGRDLAEMIAAICAAPDNYRSNENENMKKDGTRVWVNWTNKEVYNNKTKRKEILCVGSDVSVRREMEEALRKSEQRFIDVMRASKDAILLIYNNTFIDCNESTATMLGYATREEFLQSHPSELSPETQPDGRESYEKADEMMRIAYQRGFHRFEWLHTRADGKEFPVEVSLTPIIYEGKNMLYCVWRDITEAKLIEKDLAIKSLALDQIQDHVTITDLDGKITYVNTAQEKLLGIPTEDMLGKTTDVFGEDAEKGATQKEILKKTLRDGIWRGEVVNYTAEGSEIIMDCRTQVVFDELEQPVALCGIATNITERKYIEEELRNSRNNLTAIINASPESAFLIDTDGKVILCNPIAAHRLGFRIEDVCGKTLYSFLSPELAKTRRARVEEVKKSGKPIIFEDVRDGKTLRHHVYPAKDDGGIVHYIAIFGHDITEYRDKEQSLKIQKELLTSIQKIQGLFISGQSHGEVYKNMLNILVNATNSTYGFFDEVLRDADGTPYKLSLSMTDISWDDKSKKLYDELVERKLEFRNLNNLAGAPVLEGKPIIANKVKNSAYFRGLPEGHPSLENYMGVPIYYGGEIIGVAGVANREGGYDENIAELITPLTQACASIIWAGRLEREKSRNIQALMQSEEKYRRLAETSNEGILAVDDDYRIVYVNQRMAEMLGLTIEEMIGIDMDDLLFSDDPDNHQEQIELRRSGKSSQYERRFKHKDGRTLWMLVSATLLIDDEGRFEGSFAMLTDITERKLAEQALQKSEEQMKGLSHNLIVSLESERYRLSRELHDHIGRSLTGLALEIAWMMGLSSVSPENLASLSEKIETAATEVRRICKGLRPLVLDDMGLKPAIRAMAKEFMERNKIKTRLFLADVGAEEISPDSTICVFRVAQESLTNIEKHANAKNVSISMTKKADWLKIMITDDGKGFDIEEKQVEKAIKKGLGMIGMRERAMICGGDLEVKSARGKGTQIVMKVPILRQTDVN